MSAPASERRLASPRADASGHCSLCMRDFKGALGLTVHRRAKHPQEEYSCERGAPATGPVAHGKTPVNGLHTSADQVNRHDQATSAQEPAACGSSVGVQHNGPICRPVKVSLQRLDPTKLAGKGVSSGGSGRPVPTHEGRASPTVNGSSSSANPEKRQDSATSAQDPGACGSSLGVQHIGPVCRPATVTLRRLDPTMLAGKGYSSSGPGCSDPSARDVSSTGGACRPSTSGGRGGGDVRRQKGGGPNPVVTRPSLQGVNDAGRFVCGSCPRSFATCIGRSQHERHRHPAEYHAARVMSDNHRKSRWTD